VTIIFFVMPPFLMSKSLRQFGSNKSHIVSLPQSSFTSPTHDLFFVPPLAVQLGHGERRRFCGNPTETTGHSQCGNEYTLHTSRA